jgi:hypothetical protein
MDQIQLSQNVEAERGSIKATEIGEKACRSHCHLVRAIVLSPSCIAIENLVTTADVVPPGRRSQLVG